MQNIWDEIVGKLKKFVHDADYKKVVIGGSGGIDSSVVVCLAAVALGKENVMVVMMPSPYSSIGSTADTLALTRNWGLSTVTMPITKSMVAFDGSMYGVAHAMQEFAGKPRPDTFTKENIQARIRMILLMALSNEYNCLVLNTCNKSEDYTGYCTLYGDSCGAIAPIGDLYKTEVYELARWINDHPKLPNIPEAIIEKEPSAELSDGQLDTDSLPPYDELDPILKLYLDDGAPLQVFEEKGYHPVRVQQIIKLADGSAYKRAQSAPVLKLDRGGQ